MDVIPVIDLMGGQVVHARRGTRDGYRPIESALAPGSDPAIIATALLALAPFRRLYIADLDAIRRHGDHDGLIAGLAGHPELEIWVDRGETDTPALMRRATSGPGVSVIGSESHSDVAALSRALIASPTVLSLDHDAEGPLGPLEIHGDASLWPSKVIVMTLARVGAGDGPDLRRVAEIVSRAGGRQVFAAGGVRGEDDLMALMRVGAAGALVASALHDGRLTPDALRRIAEASPQTPPRP